MYIFILKRKWVRNCQDHWICLSEIADNLSSTAQIGKIYETPFRHTIGCKTDPKLFLSLKSLKDSEISQQQLIIRIAWNLTHCLKSSHHVILGGSDLILIYHISFHSLTKVLNSTCYSFIISKQSHLLKDTFSYLPMINERYFREFLHSPWLVTIPSLQRLTLTLSTVLTAGCIFILFVCGATGKQLGCDYSEWAQEY